MSRSHPLLPFCRSVTAQANPSLPVVERLEDLWLLSRLQQERKAAQQQQQQQQEQAAKQLQHPGLQGATHQQLQRPHTACDSASNSAAPGNVKVTAGAGVAQQAGTPVPLEQTPASMAPDKADAVPVTATGGTQPAQLLATPGSIASKQDAQRCTVAASAAANAEEVPGSSIVGTAAAQVSWLYDLD